MRITPTFALLLFIFIVLISIICALFFNNYQSYDSNKFHTFIVVFSGLGVVITFMFYYSVVSLQQQQYQLTILEQTSRINDYLSTNLLNEIKLASTKIPNFTLSLLPLSQCPTPLTPDEDNPENCVEKNVLAYKIFNLWQDTINSNAYLYLEQQAYISNFLQRANSKILYEIWQENYINFNQRTKTLAELLFKYGLPITEQTPENYLKVANELINDPIYIDLIKNK